MSQEELELTQRFLEEARDQLSEVEHLLLQMEQSGKTNRETVDEVFRFVHSLKSASGFFGFHDILSTTHLMENAIENLREDDSVQPLSVDYLINACDDVRRMMEVRNSNLGQSAFADDTSGIRRDAAASPFRKPRASVPAGYHLDQLANITNDLFAKLALFREADITEDLLRTILVEMGESVEQLQETVSAVRTVSADSLIMACQRTVRDISHQLDKQCEFHCHTADFQADRTIVDGLLAPLLQLVRNSVAHGIESPEKRIDLGKEPSGKITLSISQRHGQVHVSLSDDGRGIDLSSLDQNHSSEDSPLDVLCSPGFSTSTEVSEVSGRGVGMDIVRRDVAALGGTLAVCSHVGIGTTFEITLPTKLPIIPAVIVETGNRRLAIPKIHIVRQLQLGACQAPDGLRPVGRNFILQFGARKLPLVEVFPSSGLPSFRTALILSVGGTEFCMMVDRCLETRDITIRPLTRKTNASHLLRGTSLACGGEAFVPDFAALQTTVQNFWRTCSLDDTTLQDQPLPTNKPFVVFDDHRRNQIAVPLQRVREIRRIARCEAVTGAGRTHFLLQGQNVSVVNLMPSSQHQEFQHGYHLVIEQDDNTLAAIPVPRDFQIKLVDSNQVNTSQRTAMEINGRFTYLFDGAAFRPFGTPHIAANAGRSKLAIPAGGRVLIVDDSSVLRERLRRRLENVGFHVHLVRNAASAMELLRSQWIDAIVVDMELPNLEGTELVRRIRRELRFQDHPVILMRSEVDETASERVRHAGGSCLVSKADLDRVVELLSGSEFSDSQILDDHNVTSSVLA
ncbi:MAG: response regulator [Pirellulaceae bacterium]